MKIDHIGYAVKNIGQALESFENLGFTFEPIVDDPDRNIRIAFGEKDGYRIELVCSLDKSKKSPVHTYLSNVGPIPYHICYRSMNLDDEVEKLKRQGFKVIIEASPSIAFLGKRVIFMMNLALGLFEIVEA